MTTTAIIDRAEASPFRPFTLKLNSGGEYIVTTRSRIGWNTKGNTFVFFDDEGHIVLLDPASITELVQR